jgi:4-amino-4-deoxychorismate lyase
MLTEQLVVVDKSSSVLPIDDRLFLGEGLFETIKVVQQQPCYSLMHWQRMLHAASRLAIPFDVSFEQWQSQLFSCIESSGLLVGGIKVILSGGSAPRGLCAQGKVSRLITDAFTDHDDSRALSLISARWLRDASNPIYQIKSVNYLESILARREALAHGADDVLFFNLENYATETSVANLFIIDNDKIYTPMLENGVLAGIIRARILSLSLKAGISCIESPISTDMITNSDAVFVTNSIQNIRLVKTLNGYSLPVNHRLVGRLQRLLLDDDARFTGSGAYV